MKQYCEVKLTDEQQEELRPLYEIAISENSKGYPGIILCQPFHGRKIGEQEHSLNNIMRCCFIPHGLAMKIIALFDEIEE